MAIFSSLMPAKRRDRRDDSTDFGSGHGRFRDHGDHGDHGRRGGRSGHGDHGDHGDHGH